MSSRPITIVMSVTLAALVVACGSGGAQPTVGPVAPGLTPAALPTSRPPSATSTPTPTATATATATPSPVALWIDPSVPAPVRAAVLGANELTVVDSADEAEVLLRPASEGPGPEWVLVPVVPFATIADDIYWDDVLAYWAGEGEALTYLSGDGSVPTLMLTAAVYDALRGLLGEPGEAVPILVTEESSIVDEAWSARPAVWGIVPFDELEPRWKVLRLDGVSALEKGLADKPWPLRLRYDVTGPRAQEVQLPQYTNRDEVRMTLLVMTGVTAMVRGTAARMDQYGVLYPAEHIAELMQSADIAHISNEIPFASDCPPGNMHQESLVFCSAPEYMELLRHLGTDVVELTGNHFQDWGSEATIETVQMYKREGWPHYGGGVDLEDARRPKFTARNGNSFAFMGCNPVGPEYAWATENRPGAAPCDFDYMHEQLGALKDAVDIPIVTWQYWEFYHYEPTPQQREDFRGMVDAGAKIVSGSQAHHPQAFEFYNGGFIHYGLGNFLFDQMWSLGTRQQCVDRHVIYMGRHLSTEVLTFMLEDYAQPRPMTPEERAELLSSLFAASGW
ncbi:MAG: CapA family protein [Anaerolineae bacterium]|nr:CapA family protein [Anaerolineae bacterium]